MATTGDRAAASLAGNNDVAGSRKVIGALDLLDLQLINERYGRDPLPYPFLLTRPTRFQYADEVARYAAQLPERIRTGDLSQFSRCLDALINADITVTGHVQYIPADTPPIRLLACLAGQAGYLLEQRTDSDAIDVSAVSPFDLGATVANAMALVEPGRHPTVLNGEYTPPRPAVVEEDTVVVRHEVRTARGVTVSAEQVSAYAKIQSNWRPAPEWGIDKNKDHLIWVRVIDDGDYLGAPDRSRGIPITTAALAERIDGLIASDREALRESRGDT
ncbi:ESX secretion-associated protein EspG [Mycolicibacterium baixiangningiae]|uniref:ESX secretion-associated protein EspG n=1 Tax=Mycolicibacterium baixiangningiae TaxID=2761578 RepID=UPI0018694ED3|nr:ESX secretion-associated protein EspG [Mycolicibacterium baixiangningiae]